MTKPSETKSEPQSIIIVKARAQVKLLGRWLLQGNHARRPVEDGEGPSCATSTKADQFVRPILLIRCETDTDSYFRQEFQFFPERLQVLQEREYNAYRV